MWEPAEQLGDSTSALMKLRPVRFRYKEDPSGLQQYGLVAEEVAKIYPGLVAADDKGRPLTVRYQFLAPMLLNELQKAHRRIQAQDERIAMLEQQTQEISALKAQLETLSATLTNLQATSRLAVQTARTK